MIKIDEAMTVYFSGIGAFSRVERVEQVYEAIKQSIGSCGECKHYQGEEVLIFNCNENDLWVRDDFFCADFERKEES